MGIEAVGVGIGRTPWRRIALVWLLFVVLLLAIHWSRIAAGGFPDPDDTLRLVQVRDLLAGQSWFDLHQYRIDPGASPIMHWSRLVDVPLAAMIALLKPLLGQAHAELVTTVAVPLLTLGVVMAAVGYVASRMFGRDVAVLACLVAGMSPPLLAQLQPMRIDHHGWQVVAVMGALAALLSRKPWKGGALAGLAIAAGLSISLEILPLAAAFGGVLLLLRWLRDPVQRGWLAAYLASLALSLAAIFALTRGFGDLKQYCDVVSPPYMAFFTIAALGPLAAAIKPRAPLIAVLGIIGIAVMLGAAALVWTAPQCLAGPFGNLDPLVREYWYENVLEGRPFWLQPLDQVIPAVLQGVIALGAAFVLWRKAPAAERGIRLDYLLLLGAALLAGLAVWRSMDFLCAIAAPPLGWLAWRLLLRFRSAERLLGRIGAALAAMVVLLPATPMTLARALVPAALPPAQISLQDSGCDLHNQAAALGRFAPATIFAPLDVSATILERTRDGVVATSHHRAQMAMHDVILAFISPEAQAHAIILRHHAGYVALCTDLGEAQLYSAKAPKGLMAQLRNGKPPDWLEPVAIGAGTTFRVWKVKD